MNIVNFMWTNRSEVFALTLEHLVIVGVSILIAAAIGLPLGVLMTRRPGLSRPILTFANIVQTIPSLALFGFLIPLPFIGGLGPPPSILSLVPYLSLPTLQKTITGTSRVGPATPYAGSGH